LCCIGGALYSFSVLVGGRFVVALNLVAFPRAQCRCYHLGVAGESIVVLGERIVVGVALFENLCLEKVIFGIARIESRGFSHQLISVFQFAVVFQHAARRFPLYFGVGFIGFDCLLVFADRTGQIGGHAIL